MSVENWEEKQRVDHLEVGGKKGKCVRCNLSFACQDIRITWRTRWKIGEAASQSAGCCWQSKGGRTTLFIAGFARNGVGMRIWFGAGVPVKPGAGGQRPAKSNRDAFLTDSEGTG